MTFQEATKGAVIAARKSKVRIAVVLDQITNNPEEEPTGPYGYCPVDAVDILYRWGSVVKVVDPA